MIFVILQFLLVSYQFQFVVRLAFSIKQKVQLIIVVNYDQTNTTSQQTPNPTKTVNPRRANKDRQREASTRGRSDVWIQEEEADPGREAQVGGWTYRSINLLVFGGGCGTIIFSLINKN